MLNKLTKNLQHKKGKLYNLIKCQREYKKINRIENLPKNS